MKLLAPEGFDRRFPGGSRRRIVRKPLTSVGPFREVSADGHEKLNRQALQMGNLSIPIYAYRDKWSGTILDLRAVPDSRLAGAIGHVYLDLIQKWNGESLVVSFKHYQTAHYIMYTRYSYSIDNGSRLRDRLGDSRAVYLSVSLTSSI